MKTIETEKIVPSINAGRRSDNSIQVGEYAIVIYRKDIKRYAAYLPI